MGKTYPLKIDAYSHIAPPKYIEALEKANLKTPHIPRPALYDLDVRFSIMDKYDGILQVISAGLPTAVTATDGVKPVEVAKVANDEMTELMLKHPDRFIAVIASIPLNDVDAALKEVDRAINELKCKGVEILTPNNGRPLDSPEFMPLYEKMERYNLPIYIHPDRSPDYADFPGEDKSKYLVYTLWGWPYETTVAMTRLVCSGVLEKYPGLKFVSHHCGAMVPFFENRIIGFYDLFQTRAGLDLPLSEPPIEYFRKFYLDTALYGNTSALACGLHFCGVDRMLFAADMPLGDSQMGYRNYRQTINAIEAMDISEEDKKKIFQNNARKLLQLPV